MGINFDNIGPGNQLSTPRMFYDLLTQAIRPRSQSDRTCFWKVALWADKKVRHKEKNKDFYDLIIDYAREATGPDAKNPAAVFMAILKKELKYPD
jgi:hypothetical protein